MRIVEPPDLSVEQAPPKQVRAARRRVQPGRLRTAGSFRQPLGSRIEPGAVRGYYIDLTAKAETPRWPPEWWLRHDRQQYIAVSQWGLACHERFLLDGDEAWLAAARATGDYLLEQQQVGGRHDGGWVHLWPYPHTYPCRPPWLSAMAQGEGASLLVRLWRRTGEDRFAAAALRALRPLEVSTAAGGVRAELGGEPFFEEIPTQPPSHILNGAIFALWGFYDVGTALGDAPAAHSFRRGVETLAANIGRWDAGFWSRYDLYPHRVANLANPFYHRLHIDQLRALQLLGPRPPFAAAIARFQTYERSRRNWARVYGGKVLFRVSSPRSPRLAGIGRRGRSAA